MRLRTRYTQRLPVAPGLRLDIPFFEGSGTKVLDVSGKGNHGTITDAVWTRDENGVAMSFNGTSAYIDCGNDASLNITDAITIEAWIKLNTGAGTCYLLSKNSVGASDHQYAIYWTSSTKNIYGYLEGGATGTSAANSVLTNQWYHVIMRYDKTDVRYYINGELSGTPFAKTDAITSNNFTVNIGRRKPDHYPFDGIIDMIRIYAVALTASQIKRRYEQTKRDYVRAS